MKVPWIKKGFDGLFELVFELDDSSCNREFNN